MTDFIFTMTMVPHSGIRFSRSAMHKAKNNSLYPVQPTWVVYGSRPKTHARLLDAFSIRVTSADMDVCVFCCSGERPRKRGVRFAKGLNTTIYKYIIYSIHVWQLSLQNCHRTHVSYCPMFLYLAVASCMIGINYKRHPCINISF